MFSATSIACDLNAYDFESEVNAVKWKGLFINSLEKVHLQVHSSLGVKGDALEYVEALIQRLLAMLCITQPHTVQDVEERVSKTFPNPIDRWAIGDAQSAIEKGKKKSLLVLPVDKIHPLIQKEILGYRIDYQVSVYIVAVLEYIAADILKLAGNYVRNIRHSEITCQDIKVAMRADKVLMDMFYQDDEVSVGAEEETATCRASLTYDELVMEMIQEEKQYIRDLNMIIKVFRDRFKLSKVLNKKNELDQIFSNILDIYELSLTFLGLLEDSIEMIEDSKSVTVGSCFEELAETAEFDVYERYAEDILMPEWKDRFNLVLQRQDMLTGGSAFLLAVKYVLPKMLLGPLYHCFQFLEYVKLLMRLSPTDEDRESLKQSLLLLKPLQCIIEKLCNNHGLPKRRPGDTTLRQYGRYSRNLMLQKMNDVQKNIDGWEGKDISQCCYEFIIDGVLGKVNPNKRPTERHVFLFDNLMVLCKPNRRTTVPGLTGPCGEFRFKEKIFLRKKVEIMDREDTEDVKNAFEINSSDQPLVTLFAKTYEEKVNWMSALVMLTSRSMLERLLDGILYEDERRHPLRLPTREQYRFAEEDDISNIVFDDRDKDDGGAPKPIKGATLIKLVERLTYHRNFDYGLVRAFLTTFRSFCQPQEFLSLLVERFDIPDPIYESMTTPSDELVDDAMKAIFYEQMRKRFRKDYVQAVQFRVLNVVRQWVDKHWYDFERDDSLLVKLKDFLEMNVKGKTLRKWTEAIFKMMARKVEIGEAQRSFTFGYERSPPPVEWYLTQKSDEYNILTLHPVELARQITLMEFELYRAVKPSELVGGAWTKKNKNQTSPNLLKLMNFSNCLTQSIEKWIVEAECFEERIAVVSRTLEVMMVLQELNNFNGVLEVMSAMNSASIFRLKLTTQSVDKKLTKALEEVTALNSDHYKKYQEKLRSINPPCVPFFGMYLTNILHIEEGNPDFLPNGPSGLINFGKWRKIAAITGEIQQYQDQPYCLSVEFSIRYFLETLNPMEDKSEQQFNDYLYTKSLEIEPRLCKQPPRFPRKYTDVQLKSPGIKLRHHIPAKLQQPSSLPTMESVSSILRSNRQTDSLISSTHSPRSGATPPTPLSPLTPPAAAIHSHSGSATGMDNSVFAPVLIPSGSSSPGPMPSYNPLMPPPLPPRRKRETSLGETSPKVKQAPDAPMLPPRDPSPPPPLPPRKDTTLPRKSASIPENMAKKNSTFENINPNQPPVIPRRPSPPVQNGPPALLPRSPSHLNDLAPQVPPHPPLPLSPIRTNANLPVNNNNNVACDGEQIPQLPPKTYRSRFSAFQNNGESANR